MVPLFFRPLSCQTIHQDGVSLGQEPKRLAKRTDSRGRRGPTPLWWGRAAGRCRTSPPVRWCGWRRAIFPRCPGGGHGECPEDARSVNPLRCPCVPCSSPRRSTALRRACRCCPSRPRWRCRRYHRRSRQQFYPRLYRASYLLTRQHRCPPKARGSRLAGTCLTAQSDQGAMWPSVAGTSVTLKTI